MQKKLRWQYDRNTISQPQHTISYQRCNKFYDLDILLKYNLLAFRAITEAVESKILIGTPDIIYVTLGDHIEDLIRNTTCVRCKYLD